MKILVISSTVFPLIPPSGCAGYAGLEVVAYHCAKGLAAKGHQVSLVVPDESSCPGVEVIPVGPARQTPEALAYSRYWTRLKEFDVILDHSWETQTFHAKREGWLQAPILKVCHAPVSTMFHTVPDVKGLCFVCISDDQRSHFEALFSPKIARTCKNGIDVDYYRPIEGVVRSNRYLFLARFSRIKGPLLGIQACEAAGAGLDMVGDLTITQEPEYFEECKKLCDGEQIKMVGNATRGECVWHFSRAHALLHPTQAFREPAGLAPLEAMSCKTPVIGWRYGALKETVVHGETGFLVDSLEEMTELVRSDAVSSINRERCREWVCDNYTIRHMVDRYEELCRESLETGGW